MTIRTLVLIALLVPLAGCYAPEESSENVFRVATTTSMRDSGLMDVLMAEFQTIHGADIEYVAVGTGAALRLGEAGDVHALIVHAPEREEAFIEAGFGTNRTEIAWNSFVVLSPINLPSDIHEAFAEVAEREQCFVSRGDGSGTHEKEQAIWQHLNTTTSLPIVTDADGVHPAGDWYMSIGQGMGATINMAYEKRCVTLSDRGTALQFQDRIDLNRYEFENEEVHNPYSLIDVTSQPHPLNTVFRAFLLNEGQDLIRSYAINGEAAFFVHESR